MLEFTYKYHPIKQAEESKNTQGPLAMKARLNPVGIMLKPASILKYEFKIPIYNKQIC